MKVRLFGGAGPDVSPFFTHELADLVAALAQDDHVILDAGPDGDAFLVFPGGLATLADAFEVLALKSRGSLDNPIIFYNYLGAWSPLIEALRLLEEQRLVASPLDALLVVLDKISEVRETLKE